MTTHWQACTLKLTAKQARVLWFLVDRALRQEFIASVGMGRSLRAILRKLETGK